MRRQLVPATAAPLAIDGQQGAWAELPSTAGVETDSASFFVNTDEP
jgi:hypothetical protein